MARSFNGTSDAIDCNVTGGVLDLANNAAFSFVAWFNTTTVAGPYQTIAGKIYSGTDTPYAFSINTGAVNHRLGVGSYNGTVHGVVAITSFVANTWHHYYADYDGATWHLYLDGVSIGSSTDATGPVHASTDFQIGQANGGQLMSGSLADLAMFNGPLTAGEIAALASGMRPPQIRTHTLLGYWPLDGLSSPEPDLSGNKNNGTLTGTAFAPGPPIALFTPRAPQLISPPIFQWYPMDDSQNAWLNANKLEVVGY